MVRFLPKFTLALMLTSIGVPPGFAQDSQAEEDEDGSSKRVEQSDESYRRQMELEDARARDRTYVDSTYGQPAAELEKIDKLPQESRDNIRDQLVDVIMENGEWEPKDALEDYPYEPTAAAQGDPDLMAREQEAWDEQIEKYHAREAAAFGAHRGPVPGPGNPTGQEGEGGEQGKQGGEEGNGQEGDGAAESGEGSGGTYQPYQPGSASPEDETSTAGVSESALDFLRGGSGRQSPQNDQAQAQAEPSLDDSSQTAQQSTEQAQSEQQSDSSQETLLDLRGLIPIEDLDKLEGTQDPEGG